MSEKICLHTEQAPAAIGPYSQAIRVGNVVYTSGQIALDPETGALVPGGIEAQAHRVFQNLKAVLASAGCTFENVVKTVVFLTDLADFAIVNEIYAAYFPAPCPARSCVQVAALPKGSKIEVELVAVK
ncbi:MAG: RidA family protein [Christensenellales bacterium]